MHYAEIINKAYQFALEAHHGQVRKYHNTPYINHPYNVACMVEEHVYNQNIPYKTSVNMISAAYLHDVLEDCNVKACELEKTFGHEITSLVIGMTNVSKSIVNCNREKRKALDRQRMSSQSREVKLIKLCDRIDNIRDFRAAINKGLKEGFCMLYAEESLSLLKESLIGTSNLHEDLLEREINALSKKIPL